MTRLKTNELAVRKEPGSLITEKKLLPLSVSTFPKLIGNNYIYVDKTKYIYSLLAQGGAFFLSRPRRFGKSLLISILKEIFLGNKELFKGYWIYDRIDWEKYPLLHLDFQGIDYKSLGLDKALTNVLNGIAGEHGIQCQGDSISERFSDLIRKLAGDKPIVVLIDEYDKPITDYIENLEKAEENRDKLKNFYSILKSRQENISFLFMTGVSRFSRLSVFSDLNHLVDITFHKDYVQLLGYTTEEIELYFDEYIREYIQEYAGQVPGYSREELFEKLKEYYNGYSWDGERFVYNPISIMNFFFHRKFKSFWFATGTPTFLAHMARKKGIDIKVWEELMVTEQFFDKFDITDININLLLFQTGYLTIKKHEGDMYVLSYPNREVENAFLYNLVEEFSGKGEDVSGSLIREIKEALENNDVEGFIGKMKAFLASIPYNLVEGDVEKYYHLVFYLVLKPLISKVTPEHSSNRGRMDMVVETAKYIYIFEFKMGSGRKALKQINERAYYEQYLGQRKEIILVGIGFNKEKRNISDYAQARLGPTKK
ncbi:MAG: hypothetical protein QG657_2919 [Acidobacteriota bacterium]|nr:hypothetical protein [Acidobacteriota bacterium]